MVTFIFLFVRPRKCKKKECQQKLTREIFVKYEKKRYGLATAYQGMEQFGQAKTLLNEAVRLHPCHPVVLVTMAEVNNNILNNASDYTYTDIVYMYMYIQVLVELEEYDSAYTYICNALELRHTTAAEKIKERIVQAINSSNPKETSYAMEE